MRVNDTQLGKPEIIYKGTKAAIEAAFSTEGMHAWATDTHEQGYYDGSAWVWGGGAGASSLHDLTDVDDTGKTDGDSLVYNGTSGKWEPNTPAGGGDMTKAVYDTDADNVVDVAAAVEGADTAGNSKYYGTNSGGTVGFHDLPAGGGGDVATDTIWDAKGDLALGTGANTAAKLTVGANGTVLRAASGEATGALWGDAPGYYGTQLFRQVVGAGGTASFDVSSIPAGYDIIKVFVQGKTEEAATSSAIYLAFNADTTNTNYYRARLQTNDTTVSAGDAEDRMIGVIGASSNDYNTGQCEITIINPNSVFHKNVESRSIYRTGAATITMLFSSLSWENTAAITQITIAPNGVDFAEGTLCVIVGYKNHA